MDVFAIGDEARKVFEETGKTPRQLAEEHAKLRAAISAIHHSVSQYRVVGNDKRREIDLIEATCVHAMEV